MYPGLKVPTADGEIVCPPLSAADYIRFEEDGSFQKITDAKSEVAFFKAVFPVILAALQRNYPTLTMEDISKVVDLHNATRMALAAKGMPEARINELQAQGNAQTP